MNVKTKLNKKATQIAEELKGLTFLQVLQKQGELSRK